MKSLLLFCGVAATLALSTSAAFAAHPRHDNQHHFTDNAKVINVKPIYSKKRVSTPYRDCGYNNSYQHSGSNNYSTTIIGGVAGGLIGNQFGKGSGKTAATIVGAVVGSAVGYQLGYEPALKTYKRNEQPCRTSHRYHQEKHIEGYIVRYRYQGRSYTTRMNHRPGKYIPVTVSVSPVGRYY